MAVYSLKDFTLAEIEELKKTFPAGKHITHRADNGKKLPHNGVFRAHKLFNAE